MLSEQINDVRLRVESDNGLPENRATRGIMFRAGASDFEFSASNDSWMGKSGGYIAYRGHLPVGSLNVKRRADDTLRLVLNTPPLSRKMTAEEFRQMEQGVQQAMDYIFNRILE